jgi:hypothetical protein
MKHVEIKRPDYGRNHERAKDANYYPIPRDMPAPKVVRFEKIELNCSNKLCSDRKFTASFDEVQRTIQCPNCDKEVQIPQQYWGTP